MKNKYLLLLLCLGFSMTSQSQELTSELLNGLKLRNIGPATMSGRIVDLAVLESDPYTFYAATATGGVWKTTNNGVTFEPVFENEETHSVGAIALHQKHPNIVWVGTGERANRQSSSWGDGVYKSHDGGKTWKNVGLKDSHHIGRIVLHPTDTLVAYVAAIGHLWGPNEERGLYQTKDGGKTWERIIYVNEDTGVTDVAMDPSDPNILYAATYQRRRRPYGFHGGGPGSGLHKSTDGGKTWKELKNGLPEGDYGRIGISIYRSNPEVVYISLEQGFQYNASTAYNERRAGLYRSKDKGESWELMSDWNPRPMYASQPLVDPSDESRIYMMNQYSYSTDSGRTFIAPRQTLHGDDRILWVNPEDSRHVIKGDDGGIGISYDRGIKWLFISNLPVSQYYRIAVDNAKPYNVYGGLQDNGSWVGPSETYRAEGIINEDWRRLGGGDGFLNLVDRNDPNVVYTESQYLGLSRLDMKTGQRQDIRPGDPQGRISARRNWDAWGPGIPEPELGNAMAPANWDGPFFLSHHDPNTIYAGTNVLWKSTDNGATWTSLGDLTTKVNRRELLIMGQRPDENTASLDDGIPYYPTLTAVAEDLFKPGVLYAGTDDGLLQVSWDDGQTWNDVTSQLAGLPKETWINTIETSSHQAGRAYVAINNYRNDDFNNYIYQTDDYGKTWKSIEGNLPENRVARTLREDPKNPNLLYLGTELGLFISIDQGKNWVELKSNMPTLPFNDLVIHPRDNDLVLGTHGRGVWILDHVNALQEMTPEVLRQDAVLFSIAEAEIINYTRDGAHTGDMYYRGENPDFGAAIDFYLRESVSPDAIKLTIFDANGKMVDEVKAPTKAGLHRVMWNLRYQTEASGTRRGRILGPYVLPGLYTAKLEVNGKSQEQKFQVSDDPRLNIPIDIRKEWTASQMKVLALYSEVAEDQTAITKLDDQLEKLEKEGISYDENTAAPLKEISRKYGELSRRIRSLYSEIGDYIGPWTADQKTQFDYYQSMKTKLREEQEDVIQNTVPKINRGLKKENRLTVSQ
ncbi:glycosyl hydrolase [Algoriphagus marincola]|uniref:Glycosyl hydrolase n=1 Tax=Algoriphagus marincola TaxID=264027 RepID=A0ABS7N2Q5_9BACT|nr:sialidase family protein [Algoriphagus marincola]MBY5950587.1 glycosyl hydrolase [Algoriphagus marincola]